MSFSMSSVAKNHPLQPKIKIETNKGNGQMSQEKKVIIIVDGYSTARELVAELKRLSARCFHIRSVECPPAALGQSFDPSPYEADL